MTTPETTNKTFEPSVQQQLVRDRGGSSNVLVAAAGSGKTRVLTWLFCDAHLDEGIPLEALLAITFTDKAAGELRHRIAKDLAASPQLMGREPDLSEAWIGTFHAVSTRILREFAHHCGLDPAFGVIDELRALELQAEAWDAAVGGVLQDHGAPAAALLAQVGDRVLHDAILGWWGARRSAGEVHPVFPQPVTSAEDVYEAAFALVRAADLLAEHIAQLQSVRAKPLPSLEPKLATAEALSEVATHIAQLATAEKLTDWHIADVVARTERLKPKAGAPIGKDDPEFLAVCAAQAGVLDRLAEFGAGERVTLIAELAGAFSRHYEARKRAEDLLDFDDLELVTLELLREHEGVRRTLSERFTRVLVDEFQDTNPRQAELVDLLAGGSVGEPWAVVGGDGRPAVTVVGDPRQAIYGFRYADVELIRSAARRIGNEGQLRLSTNYRSDAEVLEAIDNAFLSMDSEHEAVEADRGPDRFAAGEARVELLITKECKAATWKDVDLGGRPGQLGGRKLAEARLVAARIDELRKREPEASVVVLARARNVLAPIAEALGDLDIPALIDGAEGFWERLEVGDLMAWLRLVRNPADDAALIAVCASPLVGLSTDGLVAVGLLSGADAADRTRVGALRERLEVPEHASLGADDARRLGATLELLDRARVAGRAGDPAGLLDEVIAATAYDEHLLRLPSGKRRLANVVRLRRLAAGVAEGGGDLTELVEVAEQQQAHGLRAPEAALAGENAVRLMTIHQAKGLEYDTVIVAGLGARGRVSSPALVGDDQRLGLKLRPAPGADARGLFAHTALVEELREREQAELRRVIYVALTRARERLIVSGTADWNVAGESPFSRAGREKGAVMAWLAPALVPDIEQLVDAATQAPQRSAAGISVRVSEPSGTALSPAARAPKRPELEPYAGPGPSLIGLSPVAAAALDAPGVLSYSALARHAACGLRFHAEQVLGLRGVELQPTGSVPGESAAAVEPSASATAAPSFTAAAGSSEAGTATGLTGAPGEQLDIFGELPLPTPVGPSPAQLGSLVHELLEHLPATAAKAEIDAALRTRVALLEPRWADDPTTIERVRSLVGRALGSPVVGELWLAGEPRRELPFTVAVGDDHRLITGIVDAWQTLPGGEVLVVDYKTDRVEHVADLELKTADSYGLQRAAYALAALRAGAPSVRVVHLFLDAAPPIEISHRITAANVDALDLELTAAVAAVDRGDSRETPTPHQWLCDGCPARSTFCGWARGATERPRGSGPPPAELWLGAAEDRPIASA